MPKASRIHGLRVTANIDDKVHNTMVFKKKPILAAKQWFIGSEEERKKKATQFIRSIRRYMNVAGLNRFTQILTKDGIAAQVKLLTTDDKDKVGVLLARFENMLGKLSAYLTISAPYQPIVATYEDILTRPATL